MGISAVNLQVFVLFAFILIHIKSINKAREGKEKKRKTKTDRNKKTAQRKKGNDRS